MPGAAGVVYDVGSWRLGDDGSIYRRGRLKYPNGDVYDGEWLNGKRHGQGTLSFAGSSTSGSGSYVGGFVENMFEGFGVLTISRRQHPLTKQWLSGERYEGDFVRGRRHGRGTAKTRTGDSYTGAFVDDYYHGKGSCAFANGDVYDGEWIHGKKQGHGELRLRDGSSYVGTFHQDIYHGFGRLLLGSGGKLGSYVGDFVYGKREGKGVRVYGSSSSSRGGAQPKRYEGEWVDDEPHGVGVIECASYKLVGRFVRGKECGHGAMSFANGERFEGDFLDGFFHGRGTFEYRDGGVYDGEFVQSKRHGAGRRVFANGDEYIGTWADDRMHGHGRLTSRRELSRGACSVQVYDGAFDCGSQTGDAVISYEFTPADAATRFAYTHEYEFPLDSDCWHCGRGASTYVGSVLRGAFHGPGELRSPDGKLWRGLWVNGKLEGVGERVYLPLAFAAVLEREERHASRSESSSASVITTKLYKIVQYEGDFVDGVRHGSGKLLYENGDRVIGHFVKGFAHGVVTYRFAGSGKDRLAVFEHGQRVRWLEAHEEEAVRAQESADAAVHAAADAQRSSVIRALIA